AAPDGPELLDHPPGLGQRAHREAGGELGGIAAQAADEPAGLAGDALTQIRQVVLGDVETGHGTAAGALDLGHEPAGVDDHVLRLLIAGGAAQEALLDAHRLLLTRTSNLAR